MAFGVDDLALGATVLGGLGSTGLLGKQFQKISPIVGLGGLGYSLYNSNTLGSALGNKDIMGTQTIDNLDGTSYEKMGFNNPNGNWVDKVSNGGFGGVMDYMKNNKESIGAMSQGLGAFGSIYNANQQANMAKKALNQQQSNYADDKAYARKRQADFDNAISNGYMNSTMNRGA